MDSERIASIWGPCPPDKTEIEIGRVRSAHGGQFRVTIRVDEGMAGAFAPGYEDVGYVLEMAEDLASTKLRHSVEYARLASGFGSYELEIFLTDTDGD